MEQQILGANKEIIKKRQNTIKILYNSNNIFQLEETKEKIKNTNFQKYGVYNYSSLKTLKTISLWKDYVIPLFNINQYTNSHKIYKWKCMKCGTIFQSSLDTKSQHIQQFLNMSRCIKCFPYIHGSSNLEKQVYQFCLHYFQKIKHNTSQIITPLELDIYIKKINLAIQFNGCYWHSILQKPYSYHLKKTQACEKLGIRLIHIWQDQWISNKEQIKQKLIKIFTNTELQLNNELLILDRMWYPKKQINGYKLIQQTQPNLKIRDKYLCENCGMLIYKKI